eukprot:scaffold69_cov248-Pinguiococcus_pyrenoidosus.AAC.2
MDIERDSESDTEDLQKGSVSQASLSLLASTAQETVTAEANVSDEAFEMFRTIDVDGSGVIEVRELARYLAGDDNLPVHKRFDMPDTGILWQISAAERRVEIAGFEEDSPASQRLDLAVGMALLKINEKDVESFFQFQGEELRSKKTVAALERHLRTLPQVQPVTLTFAEPKVLVNDYNCFLDLRRKGRDYRVRIPPGAYSTYIDFARVLTSQFKREEKLRDLRVRYSTTSKRLTIASKADAPFALLFETGQMRGYNCSLLLGFSSRDTVASTEVEGSQRCMSDLGTPLSVEQLEDLVAKLVKGYDHNEDGVMDFDEFLRLYKVYFADEQKVAAFKDFVHDEYMPEEERRQLERRRLAEERRIERQAMLLKARAHRKTIIRKQIRRQKQRPQAEILEQISRRRESIMQHFHTVHNRRHRPSASKTLQRAADLTQRLKDKERRRQQIRRKFRRVHQRIHQTEHQHRHGDVDAILRTAAKKLRDASETPEVREMRRMMHPSLLGYNPTPHLLGPPTETHPAFFESISAQQRRPESYSAMLALSRQHLRSGRADWDLGAWTQLPMPPTNVGLTRQHLRRFATKYDRQEIVHPAFFGHGRRRRGATPSRWEKRRGDAVDKRATNKVVDVEKRSATSPPPSPKRVATFGVLTHSRLHTRRVGMMTADLQAFQSQRRRPSDVCPCSSEEPLHARRDSTSEESAVVHPVFFAAGVWARFPVIRDPAKAGQNARHDAVDRLLRILQGKERNEPCPICCHGQPGCPRCWFFPDGHRPEDFAYVDPSTASASQQQQQQQQQQQKMAGEGASKNPSHSHGPDDHQCHPEQETTTRELHYGLGQDPAGRKGRQADVREVRSAATLKSQARGSLDSGPPGFFRSWSVGYLYHLLHSNTPLGTLHAGSLVLPMLSGQPFHPRRDFGFWLLAAPLSSSMLELGRVLQVGQRGAARDRHLAAALHRRCSTGALWNQAGQEQRGPAACFPGSNPAAARCLTDLSTSPLRHRLPVDDGECRANAASIRSQQPAHRPRAAGSIGPEDGLVPGRYPGPNDGPPSAGTRRASLQGSADRPRPRPRPRRCTQSRTQTAAIAGAMDAEKIEKNNPPEAKETRCATPSLLLRKLSCFGNFRR